MKSRRSMPLPKGWKRIKARILRQYAGICHYCGQPGATEVDHVDPVSRHPEANADEAKMRPIHSACHREKTAKEARGEPRRRPPEPHPGDVRHRR